MTYLLSIASREEKSRLKRGAIGGVTTLLVTGAVAATMGSFSRHHSFSMPLWVMVNPAIAVAGRSSKLQLKVNELIAAKAMDVSILPVIVNAWRLGGFGSASIPARCLIRLLPQLQSCDMALLNKTQWAFVLNWLSPRASKTMQPEVHSDLMRAILLACGNLGMAEALPRVRKLAEATSPKLEIQQLQQTARNYVTLLENAANAPQMVVRR